MVTWMFWSSGRQQQGRPKVGKESFHDKISSNRRLFCKVGWQQQDTWVSDATSVLFIIPHEVVWAFKARLLMSWCCIAWAQNISIAILHHHPYHDQGSHRILFGRFQKQRQHDFKLTCGYIIAGTSHTICQTLASEMMSRSPWYWFQKLSIS